ncbi:Short-chain dehydrogenase/reductase SDR [Penicillium mononematosum]|uniref:Short-chain dehydrogenase/reductase SDR n=1 Tax=Penicillium mononematosum TaxID=268346 RepID=UPI002546C66B|nr:Short-chain dehydrogenase/reductase SDR [Penicillium mononematosum]KAJ6186422.1 Short-chain dehydrogenase/reductase SDR [Penicillium mononematosum]
MQEYTHTGPIDCNKPINVENLKGKTAIVTGGANGLGEAYVRALVAAGVKVCIGDPDVQRGSKLEKELSGTKFIRCDVAKWSDQVDLFRQAALFSPTGRISHVIANAGIHREDEVFSYAGDDQEPEEPNLSVIDVNIRGVLYTAKLAAHYFIRQNGTEASEKQEDSSLVLIGSGAAFLDCPRSPQYSASKWAMRGIMHSLRRTAHFYGSRVNIISPWYVKTNILSEDVFNHVSNVGVEFAKAEDAGQCLLRILGDVNINGHSLFVSGRKWAPNGYLDLDLEDYPQNALIQEIQEDQMKSAPVSLGLFA